MGRGRASARRPPRTPRLGPVGCLSLCPPSSNGRRSTSLPPPQRNVGAVPALAPQGKDRERPDSHQGRSGPICPNDQVEGDDTPSPRFGVDLEIHLFCILTSQKSGRACQWMACPHLVGNIFYSLVTHKTLVHLKKMVSQTQSRTVGGTATRDRLACTQSPSGPELILQGSRPLSRRGASLEFCHMPHPVPRP